MSDGYFVTTIEKSNKVYHADATCPNLPPEKELINKETATQEYQPCQLCSMSVVR